MKAIEEQSFAPLIASLSHAMQNVQVSSGEGNKISFKKLIISKCQSLFELDKAQEMDSAKKLAEINSCKDPVIYYYIFIKYLEILYYIELFYRRKIKKNFKLYTMKMREDYGNVLLEIAGTYNS